MAGHELDIGVLDLLRRPGARRHVDAEVGLAGVATTSAHVTDRAVQVALDLEAQGNQVMVSGQVTFEWEADCRRCLDATRRVEQTAITEIFEPAPVEGETWLLDGDRIDLEPLVREAVTLGLPLAPLCRPDCAGPDPEHYPAVASGPDHGDGAAGHADRPVDPRWSALDELKFD